ncbi:integrase [Mycetocola sp. BIGb0189]|uniref:tyrosine-type recombinase/integrase n=1 Tax=Mycetocola sp. BIGb0189 TaxID=2940604 RepID=UPI00216A5548|nr:site-specific integrase [Mycetocola sp. BIGb0189]MCS4277403.1 integrase [Mycetocola sp. BIGb0189]
MAGTIKPYSTKAGLRYRVRYRKPDGTQTDKRGFTTQRDAKLFLSSVDVKKASGQYVDPTQGKRLVEDLAETWKTGKLSTLKPSSRAVMETSWRVHGRAKWGKRQIASIRPSEVSAWIGELQSGDKPLAAQTIRRAVFVLSGVLEIAVQDGILHSNPARGIKLPAKAKKPAKYLTHAQVEILAKKSSRPDLIRFMAYTGMRWGEIAALQKQHLNLSKKRIRIESNVVLVNRKNEFGTPKSGASRTVGVPVFLVFPLSGLVAGRPETAFVFGSDDAPLPRPNAEQSWFAGAVKKAIAEDETFPDITPHDMRHTAASLAVSAGANVKAVQRMLGHASAAMTLDIYADLFDDDLDAVAEKMSSARKEALAG